VQPKQGRLGLKFSGNCIFSLLIIIHEDHAFAMLQS